MHNKCTTFLAGNRRTGLVLYGTPCLRRTSGAIYSGVPQNVYRFSPGGVLLANPKSDNLGYPFASLHVQLMASQRIHRCWRQFVLVTSLR